jgi:ABC-2 type transport system ATP-binding protein
VPLIVTHGLTKSYGSVLALDDLELELEAGVIGLVGANGAGKSTLIKILLGLVEPTAGRAEMFGLDVATDGLAVRRRIGYMPEHDCLPLEISATEFVGHMAQVNGLPRSAARERTAETLRHVGLFEERYREMRGYSTGMRQRVKLAQALVHDPVVAFLDEPTAGLDPIGRRDMLELIRHVGRDFGISIVISTHLMGDVERTCDAVVVLDAGQVLRAGPVAGFTEETETLVVDVVDGAEALAEALSRHGLAAERDGNRLRLQRISGEGYDVIRDAIVETGALVYRLAPERHTLADVFTPLAADDGSAAR